MTEPAPLGDILESDSSYFEAVLRSFLLEISLLKIYGCYSFPLDGGDISLFKCVTYPPRIMAEETSAESRAWSQFSRAAA